MENGFFTGNPRDLNGMPLADGSGVVGGFDVPQPLFWEIGQGWGGQVASPIEAHLFDDMRRRAQAAQSQPDDYYPVSVQPPAAQEALGPPEMTRWLDELQTVSRKRAARRRMLREQLTSMAVGEIIPRES